MSSRSALAFIGAAMIGGGLMQLMHSDHREVSRRDTLPDDPEERKALEALNKRLEETSRQRNKDAHDKAEAKRIRKAEQKAKHRQKSLEGQLKQGEQNGVV